MRYFVAIAVMFLAMTVLNSVASAGTLDGKKVLIAYFSWSGNTEVIAKMISEKTGGELFRVVTVNQYPKEYRPCTDVAKKEQETNARPALSTHVQDMAQYDVIFLGYPNWWGTLPMAMFTFFEEYDFAGKTIIPFCTHEGSGLGRGPSDIAKLAPKSTLLSGIAIRGGSVGGAKAAVEKWIGGLGQ